MSEQQFARAWDIFMEITKRKEASENPDRRRKSFVRNSIQLNEVFKVLLELGITTWSKLPTEMRRGLFKKQKVVKREKLLSDLDERVTRFGERFKLDAKVALAVSSMDKTDLQLTKQRTGISMSKQIRSRAGLGKRE
jgi:hypothetical protein